MKTFGLLFCVVLLSLEGVPVTSPPGMRSTDSTARREDPPAYSWQVDFSCGSACSATLNAVDMASATDGWAMGNEGTTLHWDGTRWQQVVSPTTMTLNSVDMVSASAGWAVGGSSGGQSVILRWNGNAWQEVPTPTDARLQSVSMISQDDGWAVGYRPHSYGLAYDYIFRWDGASWQVHDSAFEYGLKPICVSMAGADYGWIATFDFYHVPMLRYWDGEAWGYIESPIALNAVAADAQYGGWAVGEGFVSLKSIEKWPTSPSSSLNGVALIAQDDAWAVGTDGAIYHWDGTDWRSTASPTLQTLRAVAMVSATDGWAVGDGGVILHYTAAQAPPERRAYLPLVVRN